MSYTKDFLESKSQQYPEILKMTDEEALRYLDFMGELIEAVNDESDPDMGYYLGGRVGFGGGGSQDHHGGGYQGGPKGGMGKSGGNKNNNKDDTKGGNKVDFNANRATTEAALDRLANTGTSGFSTNTTDNTTGGDKDKNNFMTKVGDFVSGLNTPENVASAAVGAMFGLPGTAVMGLVRLADYLGVDVGSETPDLDLDNKGGNSNKGIASIQQVPTENVMDNLFGGDLLKQQTFQRYLDAGYPEDQARRIADSLMTNFA